MTVTLKPRAASLTIAIEQGADFGPYLPWKDSAGNYFDLSGYTAASLEAYNSAGVKVIDLTLANGGIVLGTGSTNIQLIMTDTATAALDFDQAVYDLTLTDAAGDVRRLLEGTIILDRSAI